MFEDGLPGLTAILCFEDVAVFFDQIPHFFTDEIRCAHVPDTGMRREIPFFAGSIGAGQYVAVTSDGKAAVSGELQCLDGGRYLERYQFPRAAAVTCAQEMVGSAQRPHMCTNAADGL
jgi:hypothetical protein